jgi:hypothetical protein
MGGLVTILVDNWLNVVASVLSIAAIVGGGWNWIYDRKEKEKERWVEKLVGSDFQGQNKKEKILTQCAKAYKWNRAKVKEIYLKAMVEERLYKEDSALNSFDNLWTIIEAESK